MTRALKAARRDFLFELGTEELPPKALPALEQALGAGVAAHLQAAGLVHGAIELFATPRRLALLVRRLSEQQSDQDIRRRGPPLKAAFDAAGQPTRAAQAFAATCGVAPGALGRERDEKGNEYLHYTGSKAGARTLTLLPGIIGETLAALPTPKRMRWGAGDAQFVRPVHWLLMLFGSEVVPATLLGTVAGRITHGHRFHAPRALTVRSPASYADTLQNRGKVLARFNPRRERVRELVLAAAQAVGGRALISEALLEEVTALVEWPVSVTGRFDERYLSLPREVLIATLQEHQRYFALESGAGALLPWFITVSNIESRAPDVVRAGNERVVRPRLADAAFFWEQDRRRPLADWRPELDAVTFQARLGSMGARVERIAALAAQLAPVVGAQAPRVARAAQLCKADLLTAMVGEFPELQGVMGAHYALADGEDAESAAALREHYLPRSAGDALPVTPTGTALSLADRLDTLAGTFVIGQKPSGTRDPYGLRRAAIGVLRISLEQGLEFNLRALIERAVALASADVAAAAAPTPGAPAPLAPAPAPAPASSTLTQEVYDFMMERLRALYLEGGRLAGVSTEMFDAVLDGAPLSVPDFDARLRALVAFLAVPDAASLTGANKRIANILRKSAGDAGAGASPDPALLREPAERALHAALQHAAPVLAAALGRRDYPAAFAALAGLRGVIDAFFDAVLVNDPDAALRTNRLNLLAALRAHFTRVADLSRLPG